LQSKAGQALLASAGAGALSETVALVDDGRVFTQSTAVLHILRQLRFPWPLAYALIIVPRPLRDVVYRLIARRRYQWFGRRSECMVPTPEISRRFIH
jgi:predicted DCC family thiol-disulfide oxidoreductase YuxK